jgi:flagellin-like protein
MNLSRRRAVSPIIATLLLIAIAVAAGVVVYVFTSSLAGNLTKSSGSQISQDLAMQAYDFTGRGGAGLSGKALVLYFSNVGSTPATVSSVYFDGTLLNQYPVTGSLPYYYGNCPQSGTCSISSITGGDYALVPQTNAVSFPLGTSIQFTDSTSSNAGLQTTSLPPETSAQLVVTLSSAQTAGSSHSVKLVTTNGGIFVFNVIAGQTG